MGCPTNFSGYSDDIGASAKLALFLDCRGRIEGAAFLATLAAFSALGVVSNAVALKLFCLRLKRTTGPASRGQYNFFACALAAVDLFISAVGIPCDALLTLRLITDEAACRALAFFSRTAIVGATLIHLGVCIERYYAVCKPLHAFTTRHVRVVIGAIAVASIALSLPAPFAYSVGAADGPGGCGYERQKPFGKAYNYALAGVLSSSVVGVFATYGVMFRLILKRTWREPVATLSGDTEQQQEEAIESVSLPRRLIRRCRLTLHVQQRIGSSSRIACMLFAAVVFFYICWLPYFLIVLRVVKENLFLQNIHFITHFSSFAIYLVFSRRIRREALDVMFCKKTLNDGINYFY